MQQESVKKIVLIVDCLSQGGAEKSAAILSQNFTDKGHKVTIISLRNDITYNFSGALINLGLNEYKFKPLKQLQKLFRLRKVIKQLNSDYVIDFRFRGRYFMELLLHLFVWQSKKMIFTVQSFNVDWHIPQGPFIKQFYEKSKIVAVSKEIKNKLEHTYKFNDVTYIPNTINIEEINNLILNSKVPHDDYIIAVGRLTNDIKQFDKLIKVYASSTLISKNIKLYILGEGKDRIVLQNLINELNINHMVKLLGYKTNPYPYIGHAKFKVLCSKTEGLPMVILEALCLNTPVVSFNCKSGPSEMIVHGENGLLIENQDFKALKKAIEALINNFNELESLKKQKGVLPPIYLAENNYKLWEQILKR